MSFRKDALLLFLLLITGGAYAAYTLKTVNLGDGSFPLTTYADASAVTEMCRTKDTVHYITTTGEVWGFGANDYGQLGIGSAGAQPSPVKATGFGPSPSAEASSVWCSLEGIVVMDTAGSLWAAGNDYGQFGLGQSATTAVTTFTQLSGWTGTVSSVHIRTKQMWVLTSNGLYVAGVNTVGILLSTSLSVDDQQTTFLAVPGYNSVSQITTGGIPGADVVFLRYSNGEVYAQGMEGLMGTGANPFNVPVTSSPILIGGSDSSPVGFVTASEWFALLWRSSNDIYGTGRCGRFGATCPDGSILTFWSNTWFALTLPVGCGTPRSLTSCTSPDYYGPVALVCSDGALYVGGESIAGSAEWTSISSITETVQRAECFEQQSLVVIMEATAVSPTPTTTPSHTVSPSSSATNTATASATSSASSSVTISATSSATRSTTTSESPTQSASETATESSTSSRTSTSTQSASQSSTASSSSSMSTTVTTTATASASASVTSTLTTTFSASQSGTSTSTPSATSSEAAIPSQTPSVTVTGSNSLTMTSTVTATASTSQTASVTETSSTTVSGSTSPSLTTSVTPSGSVSSSRSSTSSANASGTSTMSATPTSGIVTTTATGSPSVSPSHSVSSSPTQSNSMSTTATASVTPSSSASMSASVSVSPTISVTQSPTSSASASSSSSLSGTPTSGIATTTATGSPSASPSHSGSPSPTQTSSMSPTASNTASPSSTSTSSASTSVSDTPSVSQSPSGSGTVSASTSMSATVTVTTSVTESSSGTASHSATPSLSVSASISGTRLVSPSPSTSDTATVTPSSSDSVTSTISASSSWTSSSTGSASSSETRSPSVSNSMSASSSPTSSPSNSDSVTSTPTASESVTHSRTSSPTSSRTSSATVSGSVSPSAAATNVPEPLDITVSTDVDVLQLVAGEATGQRMTVAIETHGLVSGPIVTTLLVSTQSGVDAQVDTSSSVGNITCTSLRSIHVISYTAEEFRFTTTEQGGPIECTVYNSDATIPIVVTSPSTVLDTHPVDIVVSSVAETDTGSLSNNNIQVPVSVSRATQVTFLSTADEISTLILDQQATFTVTLRNIGPSMIHPLALAPLPVFVETSMPSHVNMTARMRLPGWQCDEGVEIGTITTDPIVCNGTAESICDTVCHGWAVQTCDAFCDQSCDTANDIDVKCSPIDVPMYVRPWLPGHDVSIDITLLLWERSGLETDGGPVQVAVGVGAELVHVSTIPVGLPPLLSPIIACAEPTTMESLTTIVSAVAEATGSVGAGDVDSYIVQHDRGAGTFLLGAATTACELDAPGTCTISDILPGTEYRIRAAARNEYGDSEFSDAVMCSTAAAPLGTGPELSIASIQTDGTIRLTFTAPLSTGLFCDVPANSWFLGCTHALEQAFRFSLGVGADCMFTSSTEMTLYPGWMSRYKSGDLVTIESECLRSEDSLSWATGARYLSTPIVLFSETKIMDASSGIITFTSSIGSGLEYSLHVPEPLRKIIIKPNSNRRIKNVQWSISRGTGAADEDHVILKEDRQKLYGYVNMVAIPPGEAVELDLEYEEYIPGFLPSSHAWASAWEVITINRDPRSIPFVKLQTPTFVSLRTGQYANIQAVVDADPQLNLFYQWGVTFEAGEIELPVELESAFSDANRRSGSPFLSIPTSALPVQSAPEFICTVCRLESGCEPGMDQADEGCLCGSASQTISIPLETAYMTIMGPSYRQLVSGSAAKLEIGIDNPNCDTATELRACQHEIEWNCTKIDTDGNSLGTCIEGDEIDISATQPFKYTVQPHVPGTFVLTATYSVTDLDIRLESETTIEAIAAEIPTVDIAVQSDAVSILSMDPDLPAGFIALISGADPMSVHYSWSVDTGDTGFDLETAVEGGVSGRTLVLSAGSLQRRNSYEVIVRVWQTSLGDDVPQEGEYAVAKLKLSTGIPPYGGICNTTTSSVEAFNPVELTCDGWRSVDTPLRYEFFSSGDGGDVVMIADMSYKPSVEHVFPFTVSPGDEPITETVIARVHDVFGRYTEVSFNISITAADHVNETALVESEHKKLSEATGSEDDAARLAIIRFLTTYARLGGQELTEEVISAVVDGAMALVQNMNSSRSILSTLPASDLVKRVGLAFRPRNMTEAQQLLRLVTGVVDTLGPIQHKLGFVAPNLLAAISGATEYLPMEAASLVAQLSGNIGAGSLVGAAPSRLENEFASVSTMRRLDIGGQEWVFWDGSDTTAVRLPSTLASTEASISVTRFQFADGAVLAQSEVGTVSAAVAVVVIDSQGTSPFTRTNDTVIPDRISVRLNISKYSGGTVRCLAYDAESTSWSGDSCDSPTIVTSPLVSVGCTCDASGATFVAVIDIPPTPTPSGSVTPSASITRSRTPTMSASVSASVTGSSSALATSSVSPTAMTTASPSESAHMEEPTPTPRETELFISVSADRDLVSVVPGSTTGANLVITVEASGGALHSIPIVVELGTKPGVDVRVDLDLLSPAIECDSMAASHSIFYYKSEFRFDSITQSSIVRCAISGATGIIPVIVTAPVLAWEGGLVEISASWTLDTSVPPVVSDIDVPVVLEPEFSVSFNGINVDENTLSDGEEADITYYIQNDGKGMVHPLLYSRNVSIVSSLPRNVELFVTVSLPGWTCDGFSGKETVRHATCSDTSLSVCESICNSWSPEITGPVAACDPICDEECSALSVGVVCTAQEPYSQVVPWLPGQEMRVRARVQLIDTAGVDTGNVVQVALLIDGKLTHSQAIDVGLRPRAIPELSCFGESGESWIAVSVSDPSWSIGSNEESYVVEFDHGTGSFVLSPAGVACEISDPRVCNITDLIPGSSYMIRALKRNSFGGGTYSAVLNCTTKEQDDEADDVPVLTSAKLMDGVLFVEFSADLLEISQCGADHLPPSMRLCIAFDGSGTLGFGARCVFLTSTQLRIQIGTGWGAGSLWYGDNLQVKPGCLLSANGRTPAIGNQVVTAGSAPQSPIYDMKEQILRKGDSSEVRVPTGLPYYTILTSSLTLGIDVSQSSWELELPPTYKVDMSIPECNSWALETLRAIDLQYMWRTPKHLKMLPPPGCREIQTPCYRSMEIDEWMERTLPQTLIQTGRGPRNIAPSDCIFPMELLPPGKMLCILYNYNEWGVIRHSRAYFQIIREPVDLPVISMTSPSIVSGQASGHVRLHVDFLWRDPSVSLFFRWSLRAESGSLSPVTEFELDYYNEGEGYASLVLPVREFTPGDTVHTNVTVCYSGGCPSSDWPRLNDNCQCAEASTIFFVPVEPVYMTVSGGQYRQVTVGKASVLQVDVVDPNCGGVGSAKECNVEYQWYCEEISPQGVAIGECSGLTVQGLVSGEMSNMVSVTQPGTFRFTCRYAVPMYEIAEQRTTTWEVVANELPTVEILLQNGNIAAESVGAAETLGFSAIVDDLGTPMNFLWSVETIDTTFDLDHAAPTGVGQQDLVIRSFSLDQMTKYTIVVNVWDQSLGSGRPADGLFAVARFGITTAGSPFGGSCNVTDSVVTAFVPVEIKCSNWRGSRGLYEPLQYQFFESNPTVSDTKALIADVVNPPAYTHKFVLTEEDGSSADRLVHVRIYDPMKGYTDVSFPVTIVANTTSDVLTVSDELLNNVKTAERDHDDRSRVQHIRQFFQLARSSVSNVPNTTVSAFVDSTLELLKRNVAKSAAVMQLSSASHLLKMLTSAQLSTNSTHMDRFSTVLNGIVNMLSSYAEPGMETEGNIFSAISMLGSLAPEKAAGIVTDFMDYAAKVVILGDDPTPFESAFAVGEVIRQRLGAGTSRGTFFGSRVSTSSAAVGQFTGTVAPVTIHYSAELQQLTSTVSTAVMWYPELPYVFPTETHGTVVSSALSITLLDEAGTRLGVRELANLVDPMSIDVPITAGAYSGRSVYCYHYSNETSEWSADWCTATITDGATQVRCSCHNFASTAFVVAEEPKSGTSFDPVVAAVVVSVVTVAVLLGVSVYLGVRKRRAAKVGSAPTTLIGP